MLLIKLISIIEEWKLILLILTWNWQKKDWPNFTFKKELLIEFETQFLQQIGEFRGSIQYTAKANKNKLIVDLKK